MQNKLKFLAILFLGLLSTSLFNVANAENTSSNASANDPWLMIQKAAFAARELNYRGTFLYQNGNQSNSVQITHMNNSGREFTRNVILNAHKPREVFSDGSDIVIFNPQKNKIVIEKRRGQNLFPAILPVNLDSLKISYKLRMVGSDNIAGRNAYVVELVPNDAYRYNYKVWLDKEYGLLLKLALLNDKNQTLEQVIFQELSMLNTHDLNWFQPKIDLSKSYVMEDVALLNRVSTNWIVAELPPGYVKVDHIERASKGKKGLINQMIFSDGLASVSLFIEPLTKGVRPKMGQMIVGSTNICAHMIDGYQITVVGEVPAATVQQIAKAVSFKKQTASH